MSKIVKKADLDVLIESTLKTAGIEVPKKKKIVTESKLVDHLEKVKKDTTRALEIMDESVSSKKPLINEDLKREMDRFNKLTNFKH